MEDTARTIGLNNLILTKTFVLYLETLKDIAHGVVSDYLFKSSSQDN